MTADDPHDLARFVAAQEATFKRALAELRAGTERSHWMWFVFPQVAGLGSSSMARRYAIASLDEARAFIAHPLLGPRLREATGAVMRHEDRTLLAIFGTPDDLKFRSSMTLFARAGSEGEPFALALRRFCGGTPDAATLHHLA